MNKRRTSKKFDFRYFFFCLSKLIVNVISRLLVFWPGWSTITFIRSGGLGDCIIAARVIKEWQLLNPRKKVRIISDHPEVFQQLGFEEIATKWSWSDWPMFHVLYEHYDWSVFRLSQNLNIGQIMSRQLGFTLTTEFIIPTIKNKDENFEQQYINQKNYLIIHPFAGDWLLQRNWSAAKWQQLISYMNKDGWLVYQIGHQQDPLLPAVIDLRGMPWPLLNQLLARAKYFIGVNSFGEQLAGLYQLPSLIIYGPTNPVYSLNSKQKALFGNDQCIDYHQLSHLDYQFVSTDLVRSEFVYRCFIKLTTYT